MSQQSSDSVSGRVSNIDADLEQSSDFSATIYGGNQQSSDEIKTNILCDICKRDGKQTEAEGFCVDCQEFFCIDCYNFHRKLTVLQNHVLLNKETMPKTTKKKVKDICEERCSTHPDRVTEFICQSCDQLGCTVCMTTMHNQCSKIDHIPDIIDGLEEAKEYRELKDELKGIAVKLDQNKAKYESNLHRKSYMKEQATAAIKTHRENMNKMYDMFEKEIESELTSMEEYNADLLKSVLSRQESLTLDLQTMTSDLEHKQNTGQKCKLFISMKKAKDTVTSLQDEVMKLEINNHLANYKFQPSDDFVDLMEGIKHSGKIQLVHSSLKKEEVHREEINIKSDDDKVSCTISDVCLLPDHRLVFESDGEAMEVIDVNGKVSFLSLDPYENSKWKIAGKDTGSAMSSKPWGVTSLEENKLAVTLPDEKKIKFLTCDKQSSITIDKDINVSGFCRGIAHSRGQLIVSYDKPESNIQILDSEGQVESTFTRDCLGNQLFIKPWYLALSPDGYTIYVSDHSKNTVTSLTTDGKVKAIFEDRDLKKPVGIAVDDAGSLFVVGSSLYSSNIHQLADNLSQVQVLEDFSHGITCPRSAIYDSKQEKLYVGMEFSEKLLVITMKEA